MIWFFDRQGQKLRYEVRHEEHGDGYELSVLYPDGRVELERHRDPDILLKRCAELAESLEENGWRPH
jgi:hypothetical protein